MQQIKFKQSYIARSQKLIIENKEEIKGKDLKLAELSVQKEQVLGNIEIKKSQRQNMPEGDQFERNRREISTQIDILSKKSGQIEIKIQKIQAQKAEFNKDIKKEEQQIADLNIDLKSLRKGAQLTSMLREQFDKFFNGVEALMDSQSEVIDQSQQESWLKRQIEAIDKYVTACQTLDDRLKQRQSEQTEQIRPFLFQLRKKLDKQRKYLDECQCNKQKSYQAILNRKKQQQEKIELYNKRVSQLTQSKYHKTQLYLQLLTKHQQTVAPKSEAQGEKSQRQLQELKKKRLALQVLRQKQVYLSQMKVLIELLQLGGPVLEANKFDLAKYKTLLAKKLQTIKIITSNPSQQSLTNPEFLQINKQISALTANLDTTNLHIPYRYPIQLLLTTKQQLLEEHFQKQIQQLQKKLPQEISRTNKLTQQKKQLQNDLAALNLELEEAIQQYSSFTTECAKKLKGAIGQQDHAGEILLSELKQAPKLANVITNLEDITKQSRVFLGNTTNKELVERYEEAKRQSSNIMMQWFKLEQKYLNPAPISSTTKPKSHLKKNDERTRQLQLKLAQLLKKAKAIFEYKQKEGENSSFRKSNVGLYSSIY